MIRLFRKIRQRLLIENKFGKYLLYAIGEIIILIFGIVFALQVNNWNLKRQDKASEIVILKGIKAELERDLVGFSNDLLVHAEQIRSSKIILDHFENNLSYNDSLSKHFLNTCSYTIITINRGTFETLKSLGVGMISNIELRNLIINLYDSQYSFTGELGKGIENFFNYGEKYILISRFHEAEYYGMDLGEHLELVESAGGGMIPIDFERLKNDSEYNFYLKTAKNKNIIYLAILTDTKSMMSQLILSIEKELNELEK